LELRRIVIEELIEQSHEWLKGFALNYSHLELCDQHGTPIPPKTPDIDAIFKTSWCRNVGKSATKFVGPPGNRPVVIFLVMNATLYEDIIDHCIRADQGYINPPSQVFEYNFSVSFQHNL